MSDFFPKLNNLSSGPYFGALKVEFRVKVYCWNRRPFDLALFSTIGLSSFTIGSYSTSTCKLVSRVITSFYFFGDDSKRVPDRSLNSGHTLRSLINLDYFLKMGLYFPKINPLSLPRLTQITKILSVLESTYVQYLLKLPFFVWLTPYAWQCSCSTSYVPLRTSVVILIPLVINLPGCLFIMCVNKKNIFISGEFNRSPSII